MKRLFLIVTTVAVSLLCGETNTITCSETLMMTSVIHTDVYQDADDAWVTTVVMTIDREYNAWLNDIIPPCNVPIMVKGVGKSMRRGMANEKARMNAMRNIACIEHEYYAEHRVYERYWESPLYMIKRKLNIGDK